MIVAFSKTVQGNPRQNLNPKSVPFRQFPPDVERHLATLCVIGKFRQN
jgi:hypothetical protein